MANLEDSGSLIDHRLHFLRARPETSLLSQAKPVFEFATETIHMAYICILILTISSCVFLHGYSRPCQLESTCEGKQASLENRAFNLIQSVIFKFGVKLGRGLGACDSLPARTHSPFSMASFWFHRSLESGRSLWWHIGLNNASK